MKNDLPNNLDKCIDQIKNGETIEECLADFPELKDELEPFLRSAEMVSSLPKMEISEKHRKHLSSRLISRLQKETAEQKAVDIYQRVSFRERLASIRRWFQGSLFGTKNVAIPVTIIAIIALIVSVGIPSLSSTPEALASGCTLSIYSGSVDILSPGDEVTKTGTDGMTLEVGTRIITAPESHALVTFFDGSTLKLESETDVEIQRILSDDAKNIDIIIKQWVGTTWSKVVKMADPDSHYEILTPTAAAIVRGTMFSVEVDDTGETIVATSEGLVSVIGEDEEVFVPAGWETKVKKGATPIHPFKTPATKVDHQLPENAVAPPFNGSLPDNAAPPASDPPPFDDGLPDQADPPPFDGGLPDDANPPPFDGGLPDGANPPPFDGGPTRNNND